jgi:hypothetical protein
MPDLSTIISQLGFPIFVSVWMLYKTSADSEAMRESINELKNAITLMTNEVAHHYKDEDDKNANS